MNADSKSTHFENSISSFFYTLDILKMCFTPTVLRARDDYFIRILESFLEVTLDFWSTQNI
jgi:hypothetical protein